MIIVTSWKHRIERFILYIILYYILYIIKGNIFTNVNTNVLDLNSSLYLAKFFIPTLISESVSMPSPKKDKGKCFFWSFTYIRWVDVWWWTDTMCYNVSQPLSMILTHLCCLKMITAILTQKSQYKI